METINKRIYRIRGIFANGENKEFARLLGKKQNQTANWVRENASVGASVVELLLKTFPEVRREWLVLGQEPMLKSGTVVEEPSQPYNCGREKQKIIDIQVSAGHGVGLEGDEQKVVETVSIPGFNGCIGIMVYGDSMYDRYRSGDIVFIRRIYNIEDVDTGQCYVVVTREDRLIKIIYESEKPGHYTLVSYNNALCPDGRRKYPDRDIPKSDIVFLYKVSGKLRRTQL